MYTPTWLQPGEKVTQVGEVFGTPLVVKGLSWLPVMEGLVWGILAWLAGYRQPGLSWPQRLRIGAVDMAVALGLEWCHNFAHAAAARWIRKPMDALRIFLGMPLVVYYTPEDDSVTPRQHIARSLAGPLFNMAMLLPALLLRSGARRGTLAHEAAGAAVITNTFIAGGGLLPIPFLDGGPVLKWSLVSLGCTPGHANKGVRIANGVAALGLAAGSVAALSRNRRSIWGWALLPFALSCGAYATRLLRE